MARDLIVQFRGSSKRYGKMPQVRIPREQIKEVMAEYQKAGHIVDWSRTAPSEFKADVRIKQREVVPTKVVSEVVVTKAAPPKVIEVTKAEAMQMIKERTIERLPPEIKKRYEEATIKERTLEEIKKQLPPTKFDKSIVESVLRGDKPKIEIAKGVGIIKLSEDISKAVEKAGDVAAEKAFGTKKVKVILTPLGVTVIPQNKKTPPASIELIETTAGKVADIGSFAIPVVGENRFLVDVGSSLEKLAGGQKLTTGEKIQMAVFAAIEGSRVVPKGFVKNMVSKITKKDVKDFTVIPKPKIKPTPKDFPQTIKIKFNDKKIESFVKKELERKNVDYDKLSKVDKEWFKGQIKAKIINQPEKFLSKPVQDVLKRNEQLFKAERDLAKKTLEKERVAPKNELERLAQKELAKRGISFERLSKIDRDTLIGRLETRARTQPERFIPKARRISLENIRTERGKVFKEIRDLKRGLVVKLTEQGKRDLQFIISQIKARVNANPELLISQSQRLALKKFKAKQKIDFIKKSQEEAEKGFKSISGGLRVKLTKEGKKDLDFLLSQLQAKFKVSPEKFLPKKEQITFSKVKSKLKRESLKLEQRKKAGEYKNIGDGLKVRFTEEGKKDVKFISSQLKAKQLVSDLTPRTIKVKGTKEGIKFIEVKEPSKVKKLKVTKEDVPEASKLQMKSLEVLKTKKGDKKIYQLKPIDEKIPKGFKAIVDKQTGLVQLVKTKVKKVKVKKGKEFVAARQTFDDFIKELSPQKRKKVVESSFEVAPIGVLEVNPTTITRGSTKLGTAFVTPTKGITRMRFESRITSIIRGTKLAEKPRHDIKIPVLISEKLKQKEIQKVIEPTIKISERVRVIEKIKVPSVTISERVGVVEKIGEKIGEKVKIGEKIKIPEFKIPEPKIPPPTKLPKAVKEAIRKLKKGQSVGWRPQLIKRGKWETITKKLLSKKKAGELGQSKVDNTIAATFRLQQAGVIKKVPKSQEKFNPSKKFRNFEIFRKTGKRKKSLPSSTYIERRKFRIDSHGEKAGLTAFPKKKRRKR